MRTGKLCRSDADGAREGGDARHNARRKSKSKQHQHMIVKQLPKDEQRLQLKLEIAVLAQQKLKIVEQRLVRRRPERYEAGKPGNHRLPPHQHDHCRRRPKSSSTTGDAYLDDLCAFKTLSPHRRAHRRLQGGFDHAVPARHSVLELPLTSKRSQQNGTAHRYGSPSSSRITTSRVTPSNDNEYGDFKKRIERLKIRVRSLEAELSEEKTKGRLLQLRQLTGDVGDVRSENQQSIPHTRPAKNGFSGSFWEDIQRDKSFIQNLGFGGTESEAGDATARESPVSTTGESDITFRRRCSPRSCVATHWNLPFI